MIDVNRLKAAIILHGKTQYEVAEALGMNRSTFYRKMKHGGTFFIDEANKMKKIIPLSDEEAVKIFFSDSVA